MSMSPANLYRFFPSRRAIEAAVAGGLLDEVVLAAHAAVRGDGPAAERLRAVLRAVERLHAVRCVEDPRLHDLIVTAACENWTIVSSYADRLDSVVAQVISEGRVRGEFADTDPMTTARCLLSATTAYLDQSCVHRGASFGRPSFDQMINFCLGALRAAPREIMAKSALIQTQSGSSIR
jgi:AcrR family transcriptional regulator